MNGISELECRRFLKEADKTFSTKNTVHIYLKRQWVQLGLLGKNVWHKNCVGISGNMRHGCMPLAQKPDVWTEEATERHVSPGF
jgi:hypothetical protein